MADVERWKNDLLAAGWVAESAIRWRAPDGSLWRGPYGAWKELRRRSGLAGYVVGRRVRLLADIWDDGADHHLPGYLAHRGEQLIVRKLDPGHEFPICVSHEKITDRSFRVAPHEVEVIK